jgi:hypothetical protein
LHDRSHNHGRSGLYYCVQSIALSVIFPCASEK